MSLAASNGTFSTSSWIGAIVTNRDSTLDGDYNRVYGPDAHFQFYNRLEFDSYLLRSDTPGKSGKDQARRFATAWRDDELVISGEYNAVQTNFNPEMGFIRRKDNTNYSGDFSWLPRLRKSKTIRNLIFTTNLDYFEGGNGKVETRTQGITLGTQFQNGGNINFTVNENFDRLVKPFLIRTPILRSPRAITNTASIWRNSPAARGRRSPEPALSVWVSFGMVIASHSPAAMGWRPDYHLNTTLDYTYNRVNLPNGSFSTSLVGARLLYGFSPRFFLNAFVQYNADTHQVSSNIRFDIIHHPMSDLYLVYNDRRDTLNGQLVERAFIIKLTNLFNF